MVVSCIDWGLCRRCCAFSQCSLSVQRLPAAMMTQRSRESSSAPPINSPDPNSCTTAVVLFAIAVVCVLQRQMRSYLAPFHSLTRQTCCRHNGRNLHFPKHARQARQRCEDKNSGNRRASERRLAQDFVSGIWFSFRNVTQEEILFLSSLLPSLL